MKKLLIVLPLVALVGCASAPAPTAEVKYPTIPEFEARMLTRNEVISATVECENHDMRPFVEYISQKTAYGRVMVPVNVHCNPIRK